MSCWPIQRWKSSSGASCASRLRPLCSEAATTVRVLLLGPLGRQAHHAALRRQRRDAGGAQLDRLLDDPVHLRRLRQRLRQRHRVGQLGVARREGLQLGRHAALLDAGQDRRVLAALAVEQGDGVARRQPHHLHMVGDGLGQGDGGADGEGLGTEKTRHAKSW
jgi:hypothetical protein